MKPGFSKTVFLFLLFFLLSLILVLFDQAGFFSPVRDRIENFIVPIKLKIYRLELVGKNVIGLSENSLEKEREMAFLQSQVLSLKKENEASRRLLGAPLPQTWKFLPAQVIGKPALEALQIDQGESEGVKKGMAVVFENVLVGKVVWTGQHFSRVLLPFSSQAKILAIVREKTTGEVKVKGLLAGVGEKLFLEKVLQSDQLREEDLVLTAGEDEFPPGLVVGKIAKIFKKEQEFYQKAEVKYLLEPRKLETVFVLLR